MTNKKIVEGIIKEYKKNPDNASLTDDLRPWSTEYHAFYRIETNVGYALFSDFNGKKVRITIEDIEEE